MEAPEWIRSDMHRELDNAVEFGQNHRKDISVKVNNELGLEEDVSPEDVSILLDNVDQEDLNVLAGELADQLHGQEDDVEASEASGNGKKIMADGGKFFEGRSGRVFFVTLSLINAAVATHHLHSGRNLGAVAVSAVLVMCFVMYLLNEYKINVEIE